MSFLSNLFGNRRRQEIEQLASSLNMKYSRKDEFGLVKLMGDFQLFQQGYGRKITNILRNTDDMLETDTAVFDYQYTVSTGKSSVTYVTTVFFVNSKRLGLPQFLMKPEHFFHRVGKYLNFTQDIEIEEFPKFSDAYLVQGEFPSMINEMVNPPMARFFTIEKKWSLEGINYYFVFYQKHKKLPPDQIKGFVAKGTQIFEWLKGNGE